MNSNDRTPTDEANRQKPTERPTAGSHRRQLDAIWERAYHTAVYGGRE